jgi:hypothetical protein
MAAILNQSLNIKFTKSILYNNNYNYKDVIETNEYANIFYVSFALVVWFIILLEFYYAFIKDL